MHLVALPQGVPTAIPQGRAGAAGQAATGRVGAHISATMPRFY